MDTIRWGIIGVGNVCEVKSGPALQKANGSELVVVMRRTGALAEDFARRHNVPRWTDDAQAVIDDPDVDAVYIATPPGSHRDYALQVAAAGKPVYVEKPMARTAAECQQMVGACRAAGVPLYVAYYRRALPRFEKARDLIQSGALGEVRFVNVTLYYPPEQGDAGPATPWRLLPEHSGGGRYFDLASHMLDWLDYALGPITQVSGRAAQQGGLYEVEDIVTGHWTHASGVQGIGVWAFNAAVRRDEFRIVGSKGTLTFSSFTEDPLILETPDGVQEFAIANPPHVQQPLVQLMVDELLGRGTCPSTGESGARTSWVMDQMVADWRRESGVAF